MAYTPGNSAECFSLKVETETAQLDQAWFARCEFTKCEGHER